MPFDPTKRAWAKKFADAFRGIALGMRGQASFRVHFAVAVLVVLAAAALRAALWEWCLLLACITIVLAAEMFNSSLERIAKAIDREHNAHLGEGLDIASGAVLIACIGAALVGGLVLAARFGERIGWWTP
jgi:diacylglycerol kinase